MILTHGTKQFAVDIDNDLVGDAATYRIYICTDVETGRQCLMQVAVDTQHNGGLERAAFVLKELKQHSDLFEEKFSELHPGRRLDYDRLFPRVEASFVPEDQGNRRVLILSIKEVDDVTELVPLSNLAEIDGQRVGLGSSAWIMGRLLKLLGFAHGFGIAVRLLSGNNILIHPDRHFVAVLDWTAALSYPKEVPSDTRKGDIAAAARSVFAAIGGDPRTGDYPYDAGGDAERYVRFIWRLAARREGNAEKAHGQFYNGLVDEIFGRGFRPFKTLPL